jgi:hypothetical protein
MPIVGGGSVPIDLLPAAPTLSDGVSAFPGIASLFFAHLYRMVSDVNARYPDSLTVLPTPPNDRASDFATGADALLAALPTLRTDVNTMITTLSLACSAVSALPTIPSRGSDPTDFATQASAFVPALTTLETQLNAFITALNGVSALLLEGDMQSGTTDHLQLSGDMQSGTDVILLSGSY